MTKLVAWKDGPHRKPLILNGARQVGKTWLLREFGRLHFDNVAYLSLDNDSSARALFDNDFDVRRIVQGISLYADQDVRPEKTLIILDEIQAAPKAITSLKYFCEQMPEYAVAAAGSLLGLSAHEGSGFPVGKVTTLDLYPLSFAEYLNATGLGRLAALIDSGDEKLMDAFSTRFVDQLRRYYVVGGMPEVVAGYAESGDLSLVRAGQGRILDDYLRDFSKHIPARVVQRTVEAWSSIPAHLSQENKKYVFGRVREGSRAKDYEESLAWLAQAGLIRRVGRVTKPGLPLSAYDDWKAFKVFMLDVGLLGAMSGLDPVTVLEGSRVFTEFKGALTEQYVCQQLVSGCGLAPYYWSAENSSGEIDFLVQDRGRVYPIEVKAEENLRSKSLGSFCKRYEGMAARRFSLSGFRDEGWMRNVPLWAVGNSTVWE